MIKIAICEPDSAASGNIETIILNAGRLLPSKPETEVYDSGEDFLAGLEQGEEYSIVYMNLEMGDMDGIELAKKLRERFDSRDVLLILLSSQESFGSSVFEVQPYLVIHTPFDKKEFTRKFYQAAESLQKSDDLFTCKKSGTTYQAKKRDVICLESEGRDIIVSILNREDVRYRGALKDEHEKFGTVNFVRPHMSFVVNLDHVEEYRSESLLMRNGLMIPISELRMREFKQQVLDFWEYRNMG